MEVLVLVLVLVLVWRHTEVGYVRNRTLEGQTMRKHLRVCLEEPG